MRRIVAIRQWQADREFAPFADAVAAHLNGSAVQLRNVFHYREPDAQARVRSIADKLGLRKHIENVRQHVGRNADPVIFDFHHCLGRFDAAFTQIVPPFLVKLVAF